MLRLLNPADRDLFRGGLAQADYTIEGVTTLLGSLSAPARRDASFGRMLYLTRRNSPLDVCVRLFMNGVPVQLELVKRALAPFPMELLEATGLVRIEGDSALPLVTLMPSAQGYLVFDSPANVSAGGSADHVMGPSFSGMHVANAMIRRPSRRSLDLGSGSGELAFIAAAFSGEVYGVDCSARAVSFATFGAWLNGFSNARFVEGDAFGPVKDMQFDLVFANLPFVIAPATRYRFRDGGMRLDHFSKRIVREAPGVLAPGGFAQFLCEWAHIKEEDWKERLRSWFDGLGCDALVLRLEEQEASLYAERWIEDTEPSDTSGNIGVFEQWMSYYEAERIEAVSSGIITLRPAVGRTPWIRIEELPRTTGAAYGDALLRCFELVDLMESSRNGEALLSSCLRPAPDLQLLQTSAPGQGKWKPLGAEVRLTGGLQYSGNVDPLVANLITQCDGKLTVRELIDTVARLAGVAPERLAPQCLAILRELVSRGFLVPAERLPG